MASFRDIELSLCRGSRHAIHIDNRRQDHVRCAMRSDTPRLFTVEAFRRGGLIDRSKFAGSEQEAVPAGESNLRFLGRQALHQIDQLRRHVLALFLNVGWRFMRWETSFASVEQA